MAEEVTDANAGAVESSTTAESETTAEVTSTDTQSVPNSTEETKETPFHEHPRFKELIDEKNSLRSEIDQLRSLLQERQSPRVSPIESTKQKFIKAGMDEKVADLLAESQAELARSITEERVAPLDLKTVQNEIDGWLGELAKQPDYKDLEPEMERVFRALPEEQKNTIVSSEFGPKLLYGYVKSQRIEQEKESAYKKGVEDAYANKVKKGAVSPTTGSTKAKTQFGSLKELEDHITNMPNSEFQKNRKELYALADELSKQQK